MILPPNCEYSLPFDGNLANVIIAALINKSADGSPLVKYKLIISMLIVGNWVVE